MRAGAFKWLNLRCNNEHHATLHILPRQLSHINEDHVDNLLNEQLLEAPSAAGTLARAHWRTYHHRRHTLRFFFLFFLSVPCSLL